MKSAALQHYLTVERDYCNQMVASVRHQSQSLDTAEFTWFLSDCLDPLMAALDGRSNQETFPIALAGFKHGLELAALNWLKNDAKKELLQQLWSGHYREIIAIVQQEPAKTFTQTGNLLSHLNALDPGHPQEWLTIMSRVTGVLEGHAQLTQTGLVCAWMAGLAHYRESALRQLTTLPETVARKLLELPDVRDLKQYLDELTKNRWLTVQSAANDNPVSTHGLKARVGSCTLLGGDLPAPPEVFAGDGQFFVRSGDLVWQLYVDAYGSSLLPCDPNDLKRHMSTNNQARIFSGLSQIPGLQDIGDISSTASLADTVALTSAETFAIIVLSAVNTQSSEAG